MNSQNDIPSELLTKHVTHPLLLGFFDCSKQKEVDMREMQPVGLRQCLKSQLERYI